VFDIPVGPHMKIKHLKYAELIAKNFSYLAKKFGIKAVYDINDTRQPAGRGVGPVLEVRDVFEVLEQKPERPLKLEQKALRLAAKLLDLCFADSDLGYKVGTGEAAATGILKSGKALAKMQEIIKAQGGDPGVTSEKLTAGKFRYEVKTKSRGRVTLLNNTDVSILAKILGSPTDKKAGIYLERKLEDEVTKGDVLCIFYSSDKWRLAETIDTLAHVPIYKVE
jgi:thymidine phosphorylase